MAYNKYSFATNYSHQTTHTGAMSKTAINNADRYNASNLFYSVTLRSTIDIKRHSFHRHAYLYKNTQPRPSQFAAICLLPTE